MLQTLKGPSATVATESQRRECEEKPRADGCDLWVKSLGDGNDAEMEVATSKDVVNFTPNCDVT